MLKKTEYRTCKTKIIIKLRKGVFWINSKKKTYITLNRAFSIHLYNYLLTHEFQLFTFMEFFDSLIIFFVFVY